MAGEPVNLKKAPRRAIKEISRIGSWGRVEYHHKLECGHIEVRKRANSTGIMACTGCVLSEQYERRAPKVRENDEHVGSDLSYDILDQLGSELAINEGTAQFLKAELAVRFNVPVEAIEVALDIDEMGQQSLSGAYILLSADEVIRIINQADETSAS